MFKVLVTVQINTNVKCEVMKSITVKIHPMRNNCSDYIKLRLIKNTPIVLLSFWFLGGRKREKVWLERAELSGKIDKNFDWLFSVVFSHCNMHNIWHCKCNANAI